MAHGEDRGIHRCRAPQGRDQVWRSCQGQEPHDQKKMAGTRVSTEGNIMAAQRSNGAIAYQCHGFRERTHLATAQKETKFYRLPSPHLLRRPHPLHTHAILVNRNKRIKNWEKGPQFEFEGVLFFYQPIKTDYYFFHTHTLYFIRLIINCAFFLRCFHFPSTVI